MVKYRRGKSLPVDQESPDISGNESSSTTCTTTTTTCATSEDVFYSPILKPLSTTPTCTTPTGASVPSMIFNLIKNIVGAGVLGLPAGIAAFGDAPSAVLPAIVLIVWMGSMSAYGFSLIGRLCAYSQAQSYAGAWQAATGSSASKWIPTMACMMVTFSLLLSYSMILSRTIPDLMLYLHPQWHVSRVEGLLGTTLLVLLPLCLLQDLQSLAPFSLVGIAGMMYTTLAMMIRYIQGAYQESSVHLHHSSSFLDDLPDESLPHFGIKGATHVFSTDAFLLISMLSTAFSAHYNAPKFYWELQEPSLGAYQTVVRTSFGGSMMLMALPAMFGFLTFGGASQGLILHNYSATHDSIMTLSSFAVTLSLICSYPLAFVGMRNGVLDLLEIPLLPQRKRLGVTVGLLTVITWLALEVHDLRMVLALKGATFGTAVMYVFPSYMMIQYQRRRRQQQARSKQQQQPAQLELMASLERETPWMVANAVLGVVFGCIGTYRALQIV